MKLCEAGRLRGGRQGEAGQVAFLSYRIKAAEENEQRVIAGLIKEELLFSNRAVVGP